MMHQTHLPQQQQHTQPQQPHFYPNRSTPAGAAAAAQSLYYPDILSAPAPVLNPNGTIAVDGETVSHLPFRQTTASTTTTPMSQSTPTAAHSSPGMHPSYIPQQQQQQPRSFANPKAYIPSPLHHQAPPSHIGVAVDDDEDDFDDTTIATHTLTTPLPVANATPVAPPQPSPVLHHQHFHFHQERRQPPQQPLQPITTTLPEYYHQHPHHQSAVELPPFTHGNGQHAAAVTPASPSQPPSPLSSKSDVYQQETERQLEHKRNSTRQPLATSPLPPSRTNSSSAEDVYQPITAEEYLLGGSKDGILYNKQDGAAVSSSSSPVVGVAADGSFPQLKAMKQRRKGATVVAGVAGGVAGFLVLGPVGAVAGGASGAMVTKMVGKRMEKRAKSRLLDASSTFRLPSETAAFS